MDAVAHYYNAARRDAANHAGTGTPDIFHPLPKIEPDEPNPAKPEPNRIR
ncbi:MAG: hypothetical protein JO189_33160 [Deltaproteobacteria bacterium]|nr:hypothetical protein [Deltaproteobacteria bacterium]